MVTASFSPSEFLGGSRAERDQAEPPATIPQLAESWPDRYERLAAEHGLAARSYLAAVESVTELWADMFGIRSNNP